MRRNKLTLKQSVCKTSDTFKLHLLSADFIYLFFLWGATALSDSIVIKCPMFGGTMVSNGDYALLNFSVLVFSLITSSVVVRTKLTYTKNLKPC